MKSTTLGLIAFSLVAIFLLTSLVVAVDMIDPLWWPTYHQDPLRQGVSSMPPEDGANINIIWTWPRTDVVPIHAANDTVDIPSAGATYTDIGWNAPSDLIGNGIAAEDLPRDYYGTSYDYNGYRWAKVTRDNSADRDSNGDPVPTVNVVTATWTVSGQFNFGHTPTDGYFQVEAWFPSSGGGKRNTSAARFEVIDIEGRSHIRIVDQRTGGTWTSLSRTPFHLGPGDTIKLTNIMDAATYDSLVEEDANNQRNGLPSNLVASTIVCADAIRLVSSTGVEIYSSPVAGRPSVKMPDGTDKAIELAWFGDIESPTASLADGIDDFGAIYCVRSDFLDKASFQRDVSTDWQKPEALAVGSTRWRYPAGGRYDLARKPIDRDPIEGPIGRLTGVGGVLSSPTLVEIDWPDATKTLAVVVGGMDGQVYCVDAVTGKLIWKGPGVTMPESQSASANWVEETNGATGRYDAFGGKFLYHLPTRDGFDESSNGQDSIVYDISAQTGTNESDPGADAQKVNDGHLYAIYAWIPARLSTDPGRIRDAFYRISYRDTGTGGTAQEWVSIDQRDAGDNADTLAPLPDDPGAGRWVRLGTSYWNPSKVELTTHTGMDVAELTDSAGNARVVVADAIMVVPDEIGPFSYSSPVWDKTVFGTSKVYVGNANGRVYAFQTQPSTEYKANFATKLNWTFPKVQTANPASQDIDALASSWGSIISSPVFYGSDSASGRLLVSTTQGKVYSIKDLNNDEKRIDLDWEYDSAEKVDTGGTINGSLGDAEPFSSSPAVYGTRVYVPSASGRLHALHFDPQGTGKSQRAWMFPDRAASAVPLAAFRYSTPAVVKLPGEASHRIYVGSTGGRVYGFRDDGSSGRLLHEGGVDDAGVPLGNFEFKNPQVMGPVQGSVALDGGSSGVLNEDYFSYYGNMYIGTMGSGSLADDGGFFWLNRSTGFASSNGIALWNYSGYTGLGSVFSSPAVANHYIYVGIGKGRLCAFSATAFGGQWMGGGEAEKDEEPFTRAKPADIRKGTSPEVDLFTAPVYDQTIAIFKKWLDPVTPVPPLPTDKVKDLPTVTGLSGANFFLDSAYEGTAPWKGHKRAFTYPAASSGPRQVYLEWGEDIYAIAWNLPPLRRQILPGGAEVDPIAPGAITDDGVGTSDQRGAVSFRFIDNSPGYGSGGTLSPKHPDAIFEYNDVWTDEIGTEHPVRRSVAFVKVDIRADSQNPPPPGVGWDVSVAVATQPPASVSKEREAVLPVSVPLLTGNAGSWTVKGASALTSLSTELRYIKIPPQPVGVNCPLAIIDEGIRPSLTGPTKGAVVGLAWPPSDLAGGLKPNRYDLTAHFNGNGYAIPGADATDMSTSTWNEILPIVYLGWGTHGSNTMIGRVGTADRSAVGLRVTAKATHPTTGDPISYRTDAIRTLRFQTGDLHWQGGNGAAQNMLPWDYAPFFTPTGLKWTTRLQRDYPDISRREAVFQKSPDNNDPSIEKTMLQPGMPRAGFGGAANVAYEDSVLRGDAVESWVEVPRFQPANTSQPGYSTTVLAFLDTNNNGRFDGGEITADRPDARTETYRKFQLSLDVPPDYHMVVEKPLTVEITGADRAPAPHGLGIGVDPTILAAGDWYKNFTVRNLGNVNLYNINIAKWDLFADNVNPAFPLKGYLMTQPDPFGSPVPPPLQTGIVSSFDGWDPKWGNIQGEPFESFLDAKGLPVGDYGYSLSKAAVGDAGGMPLTIPDSRKVKNWATRGDIQAINALGGPIEPSVSVRVPLSQPSGTYHQVVPVFADFDGDGTLDLASEPRTNPAFTLNVAVAEDRITGGPTPGSAVQVDTTSNATSGDVQPTAFRDPSTGAINVIWSTNRSFPKLGDPPAPVTAENPWFLFQGKLPYDKDKDDPPDYTGREDEYNWQFGVTPSPAIGSNPAIPAMWFKTPFPGDGNYQFPQYLPQPVSNVRWPDTPPIPAGWEPVPSSLKYSAPFVARAEGGGNTWVAFEGQIDAKDSATKKIVRESRIFYAPLANGELPNGTAQVRSLIRDPRSAKLAPKLASYVTGPNPGTENMLLTWHGGDAGKWSMFAALNQSPADAHNPDTWSPDVRFSTPSCMVSTAEPSPVHRTMQLFRPNPVGGSSNVTEDKIFDLAYTGAWKFDQSTDIIFTRYLWNGDTQRPKLDVIRMPRVNEELLRDSKRNIYTSEHLSWLRPPGDGATDEWGNVNATNPFIRVEIPADGTDPARVISATDGGVDGAVGTMIAPLIDRATNVYTYSYASGSPAANTLGQTLVDFSAGIIRFTNPLPPKTKVYAQYTPQAQRLTRGLEQDSAPFMFIEKTPFAGPGVVLGEDTSGDPVNGPIGRRWLFWRKPSGGVLASSIYYKTYRMTADILDSSGQPYAIKLQSSGAPAYEFDDATGAKLKFPVEVSWDGKKIFFPADFERYPGQPDYPGPLQITLVPTGNNPDTEDIKLVLDTITWQEELPETALPTRQRVNEGQVSAFADPSVSPTKVWVFWSSTRAGKSDIYYQTISPNFRAIY